MMNSMSISKGPKSAQLLKTYVLLFFLFLILTILVTYPLVFNMNTAIYGKFYNSDMRGGLWNLWWGKYSLSHRLDYDSCPFLAAPFGLDLTQQPVSWIVKAILGGMLFFFSPLFCFNFLMFISFVFTGIITFLLVYSLIKDTTASILAAIIFTFSPYHLNKTMEFGFFFMANWLVLYVLAIIKLKEKKNIKFIAYSAAALGLTIAFNPYYGFFALIFTFGFLCFCFCYHWRKKTEAKTRFRKNITLVTSFVGVILGAAILNAQILILTARNILYSHIPVSTKASIGFVRSFEYLIAQSARPLSYLLPASTHPIFGNFTKQMFGSIFYGRGSTEQTLYLGWVPLILAYFAFRQWRLKRSHKEQYPNYQSSQENFYIGFFIFTACLSFAFSMPPFLDIGLFKIYFPSYFTYKIFPMFRAYARFGVIVMLCVSILAGYGLKIILGKLKSNKSKLLIPSFVFFAILFEFINVPPLKVTNISKVPEVYTWLTQQKGDLIIAEYPMAATSPGEAQENYDYLYYQTIHQKRMVNGAVSGTKAFEVKQKILKLDDPKTVPILKNLGVKYIIFHSEPYRKGDTKEDVDIIGEVPQLDKVAGYRLIKKFGNDWVYEIEGAHV